MPRYNCFSRNDVFNPRNLYFAANAMIILMASACSSDVSQNATGHAPVSPAQTGANLAIPVSEQQESAQYFFNVSGHTKDEVQRLLTRAQEIYESLPEEKKQSLKVAMVLHGPDAQFFAKQNYEKNKSLVDSAAKLEAFGFIDLKVCAVSAKSHGIGEDGFPAFIDVVPYGPDAIKRLRDNGFTEL
ncbi:MAG: DsrE family protein [Pseudomonadota bacterium]